MRAKYLEAALLFVDFFKAFDFIRSRKMEQIQLVYCFTKETVNAIMMLYKNTKVRLPDGDSDFFDLVTGVLQDLLVPYILIICLDYIL